MALLGFKRAAARALDVLGATSSVYRSTAHVAYWRNRPLVEANRALRAHPPGGVPLPDPALAFLVTGSFDLKFFDENGALGAASIREMLATQRRSLESFPTILDFGCGCGRVLRHWQGLEGPRVFGSDYNPRLVHWCRANLTRFNVRLNRLHPPMSSESDSFDFIYTISTFTHWTEPLQLEWLGEFKRVLRPGGLLLLTTHGATRLHEMRHEDRQRYEAGNCVVRWARYQGENFCVTYHPEAYVRRVFGSVLDLVAYIPGGARDANQDAYLLSKPAR